MAETVIGENSVVDYSIIDENTIVGENCKIGESKECGKGITVLARNLRFKDGSEVLGGQIVDKA